jgi:hypothetical protein
MLSVPARRGATEINAAFDVGMKKDDMYQLEALFAKDTLLSHN